MLKGLAFRATQTFLGWKNRKNKFVKSLNLWEGHRLWTQEKHRQATVLLIKTEKHFAFGAVGELIWAEKKRDPERARPAADLEVESCYRNRQVPCCSSTSSLRK